MITQNKMLKLMIPGPVTPKENVLLRMGEPVQPHYGAEFTRFYNETTSMLSKVFETDGDVFILNGSGTTGIQACIGSSLCNGETMIVGTNGHFGDRLISVAESLGIQVVKVECSPGKELEPEAIRAALEQHPEAKLVGLVHLETSTTVVNPIDKIGPIVREAGRYFFVDAVSSVGGMKFDMDKWGVDLVATASQKCLGAPPGLSPVAVGKRGWDLVEQNPQKYHGWCTDLLVWKKYAIEWADWHPFPVTMATNNLAALNESLKDLLSIGIDKIEENYRRLAFQLRKGLRLQGYEPFTSDEHMSPIITAAIVPIDLISVNVAGYIENKKGIKITTGFGELKNRLIRIGHMAPIITAEDIDLVLDAINEATLFLRS